MGVTTSTEVGVRELKNNLSKYLQQVADGLEVIVTDRGKPVARLIHIDAETDKFAALVAAGIITPAKSRTRWRPERGIVATGSVSEFIDEQRR